MFCFNALKKINKGESVNQVAVDLNFGCLDGKRLDNLPMVRNFDNSLQVHKVSNYQMFAYEGRSKTYHLAFAAFSQGTIDPIDNTLGQQFLMVNSFCRQTVFHSVTTALNSH